MLEMVLCLFIFIVGQKLHEMSREERADLQQTDELQELLPAPELPVGPAAAGVPGTTW